jgi:NAD-dependent SIR2 family protein deacetylase
MMERVIFNVFKEKDKKYYNIMKSLYAEMPNGYQESIERGLGVVRYFSRNMSAGIGTREEQLARLRNEIQNADAVVIGAGAGLSTSAGLTYSGERFDKYFYDFAGEFGIRDIYSGGFYPFPDEETRWAWWARHIYFNRYIDAPKPVYKELLELVKDKDYFVITTNVDHQFQKAGFDKKRLFYTQGDYGLFQSVNPSLQKTYDNEEWVMKAMEAQGFVKDDDGVFRVPECGELKMRIPSELIPKCPDDGSEMTMNLRIDDTFVEDEGWHRASAAYSDFLRRHQNLYVLYLELGVGANTPVIIKYPFWQMTLANENAVYACLNYGEAFCPTEIEDRSICVDGDIGEILKKR